MPFIQVQVTDEAAGRIAADLQRLDLHAEACCIQVLLRDRDELRHRLKMACEPCAECGHCDYRELDDVLRCPECGEPLELGHDCLGKSDSVLGRCPHGVDLDREFCPKGCRV